MRKRRFMPLSSKPGMFDPEDASRVRHTRVGVWDLYEEVDTEVESIPGWTRLQQLHDIKQCCPYVWRMLKDIAALRNCWMLLLSYVGVTLVLSLLPALSLWYSGQLLQIAESAISSREIDTDLLLRVAAGHAICALTKRFLSLLKGRISEPLNKRIRAFFGIYIFEAYARLDVPTYDDPVVQRQLDSARYGYSGNGRSSVAWDALQMLLNTATTFMSLVAQMGVLANVLRGQRDGTLLAVLSFLPPMMQWLHMQQTRFPLIWAATCKNEDYVRLEGMKKLVAEPVHRKELVAGNLFSYLLPEYVSAQSKLGDAGGDFFQLRRSHQIRDKLSSIHLLADPLRDVPQLVFTLRAVQYPTSIPISFGSLKLIQSTVNNFSHAIFGLFDDFGSIADQLEAIRKLYEIRNIKNKVEDGTVPFPENRQEVRKGISVEFRNISFKYPGSDDYALQNASFKIEQGQLCVIVGSNGSGKSTVLKLIMRLYDPTEGEILINGLDIKTLKLAHLRQAISVLFQDYTLFPLSIRDNIALGNPSLLASPSPSSSATSTSDLIDQAARLGGAYDFIQKLPQGFDTYLDRPVQDYYSGLPAGTKTLFGRDVDVDHARVRRVGGFGGSGAGGGGAGGRGVSGGERQRLAVARTFMKSLESEDAVGLLLFDEPSASLDPAAEHDLFERLRKLRGSKTMIFSSHRFGNLTRHADVIMYMRDSLVEEIGTHDELVKKGGGYARVYELQAQAFLP